MSEHQKPIEIDRDRVRGEVKDVVDKEISPPSTDEIQSKIIKLIRPSFTFNGQHAVFVVKKPSIEDLRRLSSASLGHKDDMLSFLRNVVDKPDEATMADLFTLIMAFRFQYDSIEYVREYSLPGRRFLSFDERGVHIYVENDGVVLEIDAPPIPLKLYYEYQARTPEDVEKAFTSILLENSEIRIDGDVIPSKQFVDLLKSSDYGNYMSILLVELLQYYIFPEVSFNGDPPIPLIEILEKYFGTSVIAQLLR